MKKIIVITGPTGVGKTKLSIELAKKLDGEIINADSMQVYKGLDIGTAKIKEEEKAGIPHHLFDVQNVLDDYNIYQYQQDARKLIEDIVSRNKTPIFVGGSGLYIKAALYNYEFQQESFHSEFSDMSNEEILLEIQKHYDVSIHVNNRKRLVRELNKIMNDTKIKNNGREKVYDFIMIGLTTDRTRLYEIINQRVDLMVSNGLIDEVHDLYQKGIRSKAIMTGIGYKELYKYFDGEISLSESIELIKKNSRNFAKRQYTFYRNQFDLKWVDVNFDNFSETVLEVYNYILSQKVSK